MKDAVLEAIAYFDLTVVDIKPVAESYSSIVRILILENQETLILKIPFSGRKFSREKNVLQRLQGQLPIPKTIDYRNPDDDKPGLFLLSFLPGNPIKGNITPELAFKLGELLAKLHSIRLDTFGDLFRADSVSTSDWWTFCDSAFQDRKPICRQVIPQELFGKVLQKYDDLCADLPPPDGPCIVHNDYRPGNVLVQNCDVIGLIDFESTNSGSADRDFIKIKQEVWDVFPGTKHAFLKGYASIRPVPNLEKTMPLYEFYNAFGGVAWCVIRNQTNTPFYFTHLNLLQRLVYTN
jgi:aminoglycoside phosphotransferase (APT) family kinase protein